MLGHSAGVSDKSQSQHPLRLGLVDVLSLPSRLELQACRPGFDLWKDLPNGLLPFVSAAAICSPY
jgi:hypothetical protein